MKKIIVLFLIFSLVSLTGGLEVYQAEADTSALDITMTAGSLTTVAPDASFTGKTVSASDQDSIGIIGDATDNSTGVQVTDLRGTGAGWALTMTTTNLTITEDDVKMAGSNDDVTASGTYDGALGIQTAFQSFTVKITTGGVADGSTAEYSYWKPGTDTDETADGTAIKATGSAVELSNGVYIAFTAETTYVVDDEWSILVDVFPYYVSASVGLEISPDTLSAASGSTEGLTAGSANQFFTGSGVTSGALTVLTAAVDHGQGDYYIDIDMVQDIHKNSLDGNYTSTATLTAA